MKRKVSGMRELRDISYVLSDRRPGGISFGHPGTKPNYPEISICYNLASHFLVHLFCKHVRHRASYEYLSERLSINVINDDWNTDVKSPNTSILADLILKLLSLASCPYFPDEIIFLIFGQIVGDLFASDLEDGNHLRRVEKKGKGVGERCRSCRIRRLWC
jgi:hypothetical protein